MGTDDRHRLVEAARLRAELDVQGLWLCYLALGGTGDAFDVDGYLQGFVELDSFQQDVLAQAVNEGLADVYHSACVPLAIPVPEDLVLAPLQEVVEQLLHRRSPGGLRGGRPDDGAVH
jgi:hypothetical protein